jgi:hypothetical protein
METTAALRENVGLIKQAKQDVKERIQNAVKQTAENRHKQRGEQRRTE